MMTFLASLTRNPAGLSGSARASKREEEGEEGKRGRTAAGQAILSAAVLRQDGLVRADLRGESVSREVRRQGRKEERRTLIVSPSPLMMPEM